ncbi:MAG: hypothetical protein A2X86_05555 [Bdellovibrionales bacterium GWA2_49_15]|nr:MAG: hypothetical protein A2X86_05555 [Bdellovibrionales bacterium GWA2_49_15]
MKKTHLRDIVHALKFDDEAHIVSDGQISRVTSTLENAGPQDLVVYNLKENDEKANSVFLERFSKSQCNNFLLPCDFNFPRAVNKIISKSFFANKNYVEICDLVFGKQHTDALKIVAVTGTNGKSSTVFFLNQLTSLAGIKAASLGTIGLYIGTRKIRDSLLTTPDYFELRETLHELTDQKIEYLFLEASSHALEQDRFLDLRFQCAGWTNLTHDHLDYHGNFSNYFNSKLKILRSLSGKLIVSPDSTLLFQQILAAAPAFQDKILLARKLDLPQELPSFLKVEFNYHNLCLAISVLESLGIIFAHKLLAKLQPPPGRFSVHHMDGIGDVIVDYAHTPDGLEKVLSETRKIYFGHKLTVIFGCGGNRDKTKRPVMGQIADKYCDEIIITDDNPRFEEPLAIATDIVAGIKRTKYSILLDRRRAICDTVNSAKPSDVIVIAGKGHESYQEIKGKRHHFNDSELLESIATLKMIEKVSSFTKSFGPPLMSISSGFSTDSRSISVGQTFVALVGEKFDGADYLETCLAKGIRSFIVNSNEHNESRIEKLFAKDSDLQFILVSDTTVFLGELAKKYLQRLRQNREMVVIGITGSNGKTTTKDMLYHLLNDAMPGKVQKTLGNLNNHIGLPLTILSIKDHHDIAILEMGTNHPGEINYLCNISSPDAGIITSIGDSHLEFFGNRTGVYNEKRILHDYVMKSSRALFVTDGDDALLSALPKSKATYLVASKNGNIKANYRTYNQIELTDSSESIILENNYLIGIHNFKDLALAFTLALKLYPDKKRDLIDSAQTFRTQHNRSEVRIENNRFLFLDAYNANPSSMEISLSSFVNYVIMKGHQLNECLFIIGDMNELGTHAQEGHQRIGRLLHSHGITNVIFIGQYSGFYLEGFGSRPLGQFRNVDECKQQLQALLKDIGYIFVKGSRSIKLETLFPNSK